jgi:hypothetical protein
MFSKTCLLGGAISLLAILLMSPSVEAAHRICSYSFDVVCLSDANGSGTIYNNNFSWESFTYISSLHNAVLIPLQRIKNARVEESI